MPLETNAAFGGRLGVHKAVKKAQKDVQKEKKIKEAMWSCIAKAVDNAMGLEDPDGIKTGQVMHIVNKILEDI